MGNNFWETKNLIDMNENEWESLCDKCGKCCVIKLEDFDTQEVHYTNVSCKLLCEKSASCKNYENRKSIVPDCIILSPDNLKDLKWMPETCAYKLLNEGKELPYWHPLLSGNDKEIVNSGNSVKNRVTNENKIKIKDLPDYIFNW
ncbi:MAG: YcgN family cysteine cluster protein [Alphaproteobacteria bacterium]|nr:YcgN family cysteine cluster protein [Alphaproteobacteria bacterium]